MAPSPLAAIFVTVAMVGLTIGARQFTLRFAGPWRLAPFGPTAVAFGLAVGGFLIPCAIVGRVAGAFDAGLAAAALVGVALVVGGRFGPPLDAPPAKPAKAVLLAVVLLQVALLGLYAYLSWMYQMHDEHALFGHKSMVEQLRRGAYPVYYPSLPDAEARYHYGFDILAGALARAYGLSSDWAIDLTGLLMVAFMGFAAAAVVTDEGAEGSAPLGVLAVHFGAGLAFVLLAGVPGRHPRCLTQYHHPSCEVELFPTQFLNVFQHPVAVGVPMFLVFVLLAPRVAGAATRWMAASDSKGAVAQPWPLAAVAVIVLAGAALGQFVYFALGGLAALVMVAWTRLFAPRDIGRLAAVLLVAVLIAWLQGGMLAANPYIESKLVGLRATPGFPQKEDLAGIAWHHVVNLGVGFVLLPWFVAVSLRRRRPQVVLLTAFAIGGIVAAHLFFYARSWDIVKFPSAASFALSLLYVAVVDDFLARGGARGAGFERVMGRWLRRFGAVLLMGTGLTAALYVAVPLTGPNRLYNVGRWQGDPLVARTIQWWRSHDYRSEDVIFAQSNVAKELSIFGGLSVVAEDTDLYYMGVSNRVLRAQRRYAQRLKHRLDREAMDALGVRWLMFSTEEARNLGAPARRLLADPPPWLTVVATFDGPTLDKQRRIWRVGPAAEGERDTLTP